MKHYLYLLLLLSSLTACNIQQQQIRKDWIILYKEYATYKSVCEITDNNLEKILWTKKDISFSIHREILGSYADEADSIGRKYARNIKPLDVETEHDLYGMKPLFSECLKLYTSNYLDSLANSAYKDYKYLNKKIK
ncbi:hypothetical protein [Pedobacter xixiisoli]|uniref:Lipoprotein n=1 Tax=Pedobacter xixiisoli TaxID=1476464 RepID=A0A285ZPB5_9SPHI|nr:hypothetical protein [Pedobacter xixiisoli]SOD11477.1 hypothetical protein SAMN06297358_0170 [Pedobacter xixiisoli]